jgi:hypothetical protein
VIVHCVPCRLGEHKEVMSSLLWSRQNSNDSPVSILTNPNALETSGFGKASKQGKWPCVLFSSLLVAVMMSAAYKHVAKL